MQFTETQLEILSNAYLLSREGKGQVIVDDAYPAAHALAEAGWLERRFESDGEMSWWWSSTAETAFDLGALLTSAAGRQN